jgi:DNA-binding transcriptional LysR family regulator
MDNPHIFYSDWTCTMSQSSDSLSTLKLFVRVARTGSISEAGREVGLSQPSASRAIAALEKDIGVSLLTRSTRAVVLTEAGADYLARVEPLLAAIDDANRAARGADTLRGTLRVALPPSLALRAVIPKLGIFLERHPALRINLSMDDRRQDILRDGIDVALRVGPLPDSAATARPIDSGERLLVAAPAYLQRAGAPKTPGELAGHQIIVGPASVAASSWTFERNGRSVAIKVEARLVFSLNEGATAAAVAGLGIISTGRLACRDELASGSLVPVLAGWRIESSAMHAVFPAARAAKRAARAFIDYLTDEAEFLK